VPSLKGLRMIAHPGRPGETAAVLPT